jgi:hypothetical protein
LTLLERLPAAKKKIRGRGPLQQRSNQAPGALRRFSVSKPFVA